MPCWTSSEASCHGEKCTVFAEKPGTFPGGGNGVCGQRVLWSRCPGMLRGKVNWNRGKARHFPRKKGLCTHGRCWKYEEKCYKKDCNENLKLSICKKLYICAKKVKGRKVNLL